MENKNGIFLIHEILRKGKIIIGIALYPFRRIKHGNILFI